MPHPKKKRRRRWLAAAALLVLAVAVWYGGTFWLKTTEVQLYSGKIADPVRIVQLTDLHGSRFGADNDRLVQKVRRAEPDLVVCTGDMYTSGDEQGRQVALDLLTRLAQSWPVYFVNGEHDDDGGFAVELQESGVQVMDYEQRIVTVGSTRLCLYGINNQYYSATFDLHNAFTLDTGCYTILLAHSQNLAAFAELGIDLALCGDSHGGQVRLPGVGALQNQGIWFPEIAGPDSVRYTKGLYRQGNTDLFISSGLGNYPVPIRFLNRPEIAVIELLPPA